MGQKTVDCRGLACPQPVLSTKKALEENEVEAVVTLVDNDVARQNVTLFARNSGYHVTDEKADGAFKITITRTAAAAKTKNTGKNTSFATTDSDAKGPVYFITTNSLGQGSPDLGQVLITSLFTTLAAAKAPPAALLFLNTGVFLSCEGSPVMEQLQKLSSAGSAVLSCGTCLDYYRIKEKLAVGSISNMLDINEWLYGPHKVITIA